MAAYILNERHAQTAQYEHEKQTQQKVTINQKFACQNL